MLAALSQARRRRIDLSPPRALALLFVVVGSIGAVALKLPGATTEPISWLEAAFTSVSAITVTGLVVVDTGSTFTLLGQGVVLLLAHLGGVGMMVFAVLALLVSGGRPKMRTQLLVGEAIGQTRVGDLNRIARLAIKIAIVVELLGALVLTLRFANDMDWAQALWHGVFHSVSAFNNAGFALWSDGLTRYAADPAINLTIGALVLSGGIGYLVLADPGLLRGRMSLHSRMMLVGTAVMVTVGIGLFWLIEMDNPRTFVELSAAQQFWLAWFQTLVGRTAGFNSMDIAAMEDASTVLTMVQMFVGGGTGSTAGGIKVTTAVILLITLIAVLKQSADPVLGSRRIDSTVVYRALAVVSISSVLVVFATVLLLATQKLPLIDVVFEVVSAVATNGLSRGVTAQFDGFGQCLLMLLMFIGRVGPLTLVFTLSTAQPSRVRYPREEVFVG